MLLFLVLKLNVLHVMWPKRRFLDCYQVDSSILVLLYRALQCQTWQKSSLFATSKYGWLCF